MPDIVIGPLAEADLIAIWRYSFSQWGKSQADTYLFELEDAIQALADNPRLGRSIEHVRTGYRQYTFRRHLLIYRQTDTRIIVQRVLGTEMDIPRHL